MTEPTDLARLPGVIPYVDNHDGVRRLLTVEIAAFGTGARQVAPIVSIDGRQYLVSWGAVTFEIPSDRNVHISVHLQTNGGEHPVLPHASAVLPAHPAPLRLAAGFANGQGVLTPIG